jgi:hypothetical protein
MISEQKNFKYEVNVAVQYTSEGLMSSVLSPQSSVFSPESSLPTADCRLPTT